MGSFVFLPKDAEAKLRVLRSINRPIDELSVNDICAACDISRQTFYRHFRSKYDVFPWLLRTAYEMYADEIGRTLSWSEGYESTFAMLYDEKESVVLACAPISQKNVYTRQIEHRRNCVLETIKQAGAAVIDDDLLFCVDFFAQSECELIVSWCETGMSVKPSVFARRFTNCMPEQVRRLLRQPRRTLS